MNNFLELERVHHDKTAKKYSFRRENDFIWEVPEQMFLLKAKYIRKSDVVIDMGCGPAISIKRILSNDLLNNIRYIGVDISKNMLQIAKKNMPSGTFKVGDIETIRFPKGSANCIISLGALHHTISKEHALSNWCAILSRGGYLLLREPTYEALKRGQGESPIEEGIKPLEIIESLRSKGFVIEDITFFTSKAFHLFNRIMIKLRLQKWQEFRFLWHFIIAFDVLLVKGFSRFSPFFRGEAFTLVARKL